MTMANWYGIQGIKFHFRSAWADSEITYKGVTDNANVIVEDTMWARFSEEGGHDPYDAFEEYMLAHAEDVMELIELAREG